MSFQTLKIYLSVLFIFTVSICFAKEPVLEIETKDSKKIYTLTELLKRTDLEKVTVLKDPAYPTQERTYLALKMTHLFNGINLSEDSVIQFKALDGFSAPLSKQRLLNSSTDLSIAYLAIEPPNDQWPPLKSGKASAGPFYLIWKNPEFSQISPEEWPFMLSGFKTKGNLESVYPKIFPKKSLAANSPQMRGLHLFVKHCFACHTLNKSGSSQVGPDLNIPMNPTEYLKISALKQLIRNPQDLRYWPNSKMTGFKNDVLIDNELEYLISYLKHMSKRKL